MNKITSRHHYHKEKAPKASLDDSCALEGTH